MDFTTSIGEYTFSNTFAHHLSRKITQTVLWHVEKYFDECDFTWNFDRRMISSYENECKETPDRYYMSKNGVLRTEWPLKKVLRIDRYFKDRMIFILRSVLHEMKHSVDYPIVKFIKTINKQSDQHGIKGFIVSELEKYKKTVSGKGNNDRSDILTFTIPEMNTVGELMSNFINAFALYASYTASGKITQPFHQLSKTPIPNITVNANEALVAFIYDAKAKNSISDDLLDYLAIMRAYEDNLFEIRALSQRKSKSKDDTSAPIITDHGETVEGNPELNA